MSAKFSKLTWLRALTGADLTDGEYRVLVAVFNHTDEHGRRAYAKQVTLAAETNKSERQTRRILGELVRKGWLTGVRKGSGRSGLSSEYNLSTPEIPDTGDIYSDGIPDISSTNTGHLEQEYRTSSAQIPDTHVRPSDPLSDPVIRTGSDPKGLPAPSDPGEAVTLSGDRQRATRVEPPRGALPMEGPFSEAELAQIASEVYESEPEAPEVGPLFASPIEAEAARRLVDAAPLLAQRALHTTRLDPERNTAVVRRLLDAGVLDHVEREDDDGHVSMWLQLAA